MRGRKSTGDVYSLQGRWSKENSRTTSSWGVNTKGPAPVTCRDVLHWCHCVRDLPIMCSLTLSWFPAREDERA